MIPWINRKIKKMVRRKNRMHKQAKKTNKWDNYRSRASQKECKLVCRKAEWEYTNTIMEKGLVENNTKPFWKYIKPRKEENIGVFPQKSNSKLHNDSTKTDLLLRQFTNVALSSVRPITRPCHLSNDE